MNKSEFAPWPWEATDENEVIDKDGFVVAIVDDFSMHVQWQKANPTKVWYMHEEGRKERHPNEVLANTHLIAAAPSMCEALKDLLKILNDNEVVREHLKGIGGHNEHILSIARRRAEVALAKTEGREVKP